MSDDLKSALEVAAAAAQTATTAQIAAERAAEECRVMMDKIKSYEARRPIIKETLREVGTAVDLTPVNDRLARLEALELKVMEIDAKPQALIPADSRVDDLVARVSAMETSPKTVFTSIANDRIAEIERMVADVNNRQASASGHEVVPPVISDLLDRMAALEELVVQTVEAPNALARQLQMTADLMRIMDERRQVDTELLAKASSMTATAQGGLAVVVESLRVDVEELTQAVNLLKSERNKRDSYVASIIKRRGAA